MHFFASQMILFRSIGKEKARLFFVPCDCINDTGLKLITQNLLASVLHISLGYLVCQTRATNKKGDIPGYRFSNKSLQNEQHREESLELHYSLEQ